MLATDAQSPMLDEVLAYRNDRLIDYYAANMNVTRDTASRRFVALKQFLYLCAVTPGYKVTSDAIDSMWHTFLLFTKDYDAFCRAQFGRFIHHQPFERAAPDQYIATRARAQELFGGLDDELWPANAKGDCSSGCEE